MFFLGHWLFAEKFKKIHQVIFNSAELTFFSLIQLNEFRIIVNLSSHAHTDAHVYTTLNKFIIGKDHTQRHCACNNTNNNNNRVQPRGRVAAASGGHVSARMWVLELIVNYCSFLDCTGEKKKTRKHNATKTLDRICSRHRAERVYGWKKRLKKKTSRRRRWVSPIGPGSAMGILSGGRGDYSHAVFLCLPVIVVVNKRGCEDPMGARKIKRKEKTRGREK